MSKYPASNVSDDKKGISVTECRVCKGTGYTFVVSKDKTNRRAFRCAYCDKGVRP